MKERMELERVTALVKKKRENERRGLGEEQGQKRTGEEAMIKRKKSCNATCPE